RARDTRIRANQYDGRQLLCAATRAQLPRRPRHATIDARHRQEAHDHAAERPMYIIESGPAAGVVGAAELARRLGNASLLSFDMGGTTAKAALVESGRFLRVNSLEVGGGINIAGRLLSGGGYHVGAPAIDIAEVGAGGGSIARI